MQEDSRCKGIQGNTSKAGIKCVCLNATSIINKKNELNIMVDDIKPHIIGITESWAHTDIIIIILFIYFMLFLQMQGAHSLLQAQCYKLCTETLLQKH